MGANVIRLIRIDHRRMNELLTRMGRRYRAGEELPSRLANELASHADATTNCLLPFVLDRLELPDGAFSDTLDDLAEVADEVARTAQEVPAAVLEQAAAATREHIDVEEQQVLAPLEEAVNVERLRQLGEAFRRRRDSALKARGQRVHGHQRKPASRAELYERARSRGLAGRSSMSRSELASALRQEPQPDQQPDRPL
ncbi:MAG: hypothetical protein ACOC96_09320 [Actinomycetota bacterium]